MHTRGKKWRGRAPPGRAMCRSGRGRMGRRGIRHGHAAAAGARKNPYLHALQRAGVRALCMVTVGPGLVDQVTAVLRRKRGPVKDVLVVTGRADVCVLLHGSIDEINTVIIDFKRIKGIVTTETMIEVGVNMGW